MARRLHALILVVMLLLIVVAPDTVAADQQAATPGASPTALPRTAAVLLAPDEVPKGLVLTDDRDRTLDEVTAGFPAPEAAKAQFRQWGWKGNHVRAFHTPPGVKVDPTHIDGIYVSVHEFGSAASAAEAMDYTVRMHASEAHLNEVPIEPLGDRATALYGKMPYGNEVTIYVQDGPLLIRLSASSPKGDPRPEAIALMRSMTGR